MTRIGLTGCWLVAFVAASQLALPALGAEPDLAEQEFKALQKRFEEQRERYFAALGEAANQPE